MDERFHINPADPTPLYAQLERAIRFAIATEKLRVGEQLPTVRQLAVDLRVNANTVAKVYLELERAGLLETRRGVGTCVLSREAAFAAWVITLCPERDVVKQNEPEILATLAHFRADKLRFVSFFPLESAWWRLQAIG